MTETFFCNQFIRFGPECGWLARLDRVSPSLAGCPWHRGRSRIRAVRFIRVFLRRPNRIALSPPFPNVSAGAIAAALWALSYGAPRSESACRTAVRSLCCRHHILYITMFNCNNSFGNSVCLFLFLYIYIYHSSHGMSRRGVTRWEFRWFLLFAALFIQPCFEEMRERGCTSLLNIMEKLLNKEVIFGFSVLKPNTWEFRIEYTVAFNTVVWRAIQT